MTQLPAITTCFFFSSRRRHTRYWRYWSSDVCSSDLGTEQGMFRSTDDGLSWAPLHSGLITVSALAAIGNAIIATGGTSGGSFFGGFSSTILLSTDEIGRASCRERG